MKAKGIPAVLAVLAALVLFTLPTALAQETAPADATTAIAVQPAEISIEGTGGTAPDSIFYGLDVALDRITLILTFDVKEKARRGLMIANERLLEAKTMAEKGKLKEAETAESEYESTMSEVGSSVDAVAEDGDATTTESSLEDATEIQDAAEAEDETAEVIKDAIKERVRARLVAQGLSDEQREHLQAVFDRIMQHSEEVKAKIAEKKERIKLKHKALGELTNEELEEKTNVIEERTKLREHRKERLKRAFHRAKEALKEARSEVAEDAVSEPELTDTVESTEDALDVTEETAEQSDYESTSESTKSIKSLGQEIRKVANELREARESGNFREAKERLLELIKLHRIQVLQNVLEKAPEAARPRIAKIIECTEEAGTGKIIGCTEEAEETLPSGVPEGAAPDTEAGKEPTPDVQIVEPTSGEPETLPEQAVEQSAGTGAS